MKKLLLITIVILTLSACGKGKADKAMYTHSVQFVYNYNKSPVSVISKDTFNGKFNVYKNDQTATLKDESSDFEIKMKTNPNQFEGTDFRGKSFSWNENNGYKLGNENKGDTLVLRYLPLDVKDESTLKYGFVYIFY